MGFLPILGQLGALAPQVIGANQGQNAQQWMHGALSTQQMNALNQYGGLLDYWNPSAGTQRDLALQQLGPIGAQIRNTIGPQADQLAGRQGQLTQLAQDTGMYSTPQMQAAQLALGGLANQFGPTTGMAQQGFAGGGWTPQYQEITDRGTELLRGLGVQQGLATFGPELMGSARYTPTTRGLQDQMFQALGSGGYNPLLQAGGQAALQGLSQGGMTPGLQGLGASGAYNVLGTGGIGGLTPTGAMAEQVGLQGLQRGGATPTSQALQQRGLQMAGPNPLLSMGNVINMAGDQASGAGRDAAARLLRQSQARDAAPGIVRSGLPRQGQAGSQDLIARHVADAQRDAMMKQQGLQLQQTGLGAQMAQQGLGAETGRIGTFGDIVGDIEGISTQRLGTGAGMVSDSERLAQSRYLQSLGALPGIQGAATDVMKTMGGLGTWGAQNELDRLMAGANMSNMFTGNQLQALNAMTGASQAQNQYALGLGGLANQGIGTMGNLYNQQFGNWLGGGQLGVNRSNLLGNQWLQADANQSNQMNNMMNFWGSAMQPYNQVNQQMVQMMQPWAQGANPFSGGGNPGANPWAQMMQR